VQRTSVVVRKNNKKPLFRRINDWLHLWLGLSSGLVVFIISITGCIYVFEKEIRSVTQPYQFVEKQEKPFLPPSQLITIARAHAFGSLPDTGENRIKSIQYGDAKKAAIAAYQTKKDGYVMVYMNPYTGDVLKRKVLEEDFFRIVLAGHFYLWLPKDIGKPVIATSVLIFVVLLVTGFIMWLPKNLKKANVDKSFKIKWKARFKRLNYDLHNVLGFYVMLVALVIALTGLVWGFEWFNKSLYWVTSGGRALPGKEKHVSDITKATLAEGSPMVDKLWLQLRPDSRNETGSLQIQLPQKKDDVFAANYNPEEGTYYKREFSRYDQYTLKKLELKGVFAKRFEEASGADKLNRMNYDIHVGAVLGLPGKIMAFFASLICGSLPITGFIVWWGKRKKKKKAALAEIAAGASVRKSALSARKELEPVG
jgi:uncharacterized iron-regulated membrane protein